MINEKRITVDSVPCLFVEPDDCVRGTVLFYHGWSSAKELQVLRARILAAYGYAVLVPDALYHGERGSIDYDSKAAYPFFWQAVLANLQEAPQLVSYMQERRFKTPFFVMGHSMGGITALGVLVTEKAVRGAVSMNGSGWWNESERRFRAAHKLDWQPEYTDMIAAIDRVDPYYKVDSLRKKTVLLLSGSADDVVDGAAQAMYADKLRQHHIDCEMITYEGLGHFVTTNMMGDAVQWLDKKIKE